MSVAFLCEQLVKGLAGWLFGRSVGREVRWSLV